MYPLFLKSNKSIAFHKPLLRKSFSALYTSCTSNSIRIFSPFLHFCIDPFMNQSHSPKIGSHNSQNSLAHFNMTKPMHRNARGNSMEKFKENIHAHLVNLHKKKEMKQQKKYIYSSFCRQAIVLLPYISNEAFENVLLH